MQAGKLRHRITFLQATSNQQANGEDLQTWSPVVGPVWASLDQLKGQMLALAQADTATATASHQIKIRYNADITQTMRVQFGDVIYTINSILDSDPGTRRKEQTILATVVTV